MLPPGTKAHTHALLSELAKTGRVENAYHNDASVAVTHPWGTLQDTNAIGSLWADLRRALPDMERRDLIFVGGANRDDTRLAGPRASHLVAALGHLQGTFAEDLAGIPATNSVVHLRYGEAHWLDGDRIRQSWCHFDLVDLMIQTGLSPLPVPLGAAGAWPGPAPQDGLRLGDAGCEGVDALDTVFARAFDEDDLAVDVLRLMVSALPRDRIGFGDAEASMASAIDTS